MQKFFLRLINEFQQAYCLKIGENYVYKADTNAGSLISQIID